MYKDKDTIKLEEHLGTAYAKLFEATGKFPGSFIAGGSIASIVLDEKVNDYDIWFETEYAWKHATRLAKEAACLKDSKVKIIVETKMAVTIRIEGVEPVYQLIRARIGNYEEVVEQFDFKHAHAAYLPASKQYPTPSVEFLSGNSPDFIREKILVFAGQLDYPTHTLSRVPKFAKRGFMVPDSMIADLVRAIWESPQELVQADLDVAGEKYHGRVYSGTENPPKYDPVPLKARKS